VNRAGGDELARGRQACAVAAEAERIQPNDRSRGTPFCRILPSLKQSNQPGQLQQRAYHFAVAPGDKIDITLQTIGPGQYETPTVSSGSVRFLGESTAGTPNPAGPRQLFRFEAMTVGRAEITIEHTILDPPLPQTPPFAMTVDVR